MRGIRKFLCFLFSALIILSATTTQTLIAEEEPEDETIEMQEEEPAEEDISVPQKEPEVLTEEESEAIQEDESEPAEVEEEEPEAEPEEEPVLQEEPAFAPILLAMVNLGATDGWGAVRTALLAGDDVTLTEDITVPEGAAQINLNGSQNVTLDLNGHTIHFDAVTGTPIAIQPGSTLNIKSTAGTGKLAGCTKPNEMIFVGGGEVSIDSVEMSDNAKIIRGNGTATLTHVSVHDNTPGANAPIVLSGDITVTDSEFKNNTVTGEGGAVKCDNGTLTLKNTTISNNSSTNGGGAIHTWNSTVSIEGCTIENNQSTGVGGAIYANGQPLTIDNSTISGNTSTGNGGAIYANNCEVLVKNNSTLQQNTAENGGAIFAAGQAIIIDNSTLKDNTANNEGGAIKADGKSITLYGSTLSGNTAKNGGAIQSWNGKVEVIGSTLSNNAAKGPTEADGGCGGGILVGGASDIILNDATITGNTASNSIWAEGGGGIYAGGDSTLTITDSTIQKNISTGSGGGILFKAKTFTMLSGVIDNNIAVLHEGGGIAIITGHAVIQRGQITNNKSGYLADGVTPNDAYQDWGGGGIFVSDQGNPVANLLITNPLLLTDNDAGGFGGGLAGCATGRLFTFADESSGAAIFDNRAEGAHVSGSGSTKNADHQYAYDNEVFMSNGYQDYYCAWSSMVSNMMLGGGAARWSGSIDGVEHAATDEIDTVLASGSTMGLTSNPSSASKEAAKNLAVVIVTGNKSYTHGGGILCNGYVMLGNIDASEHMEVNTALEMNLSKQLLDASGEELAAKEREFTFDLRREESDWSTSGYNTSDGRILFSDRLSFDKKNCTDDNRLSADEASDGAESSYKFIYNLTETPGEDTNIDYDGSTYRITLIVDRVDGFIDVNGQQVEKIVYVINSERYRVEKQEPNSDEWVEIPCTYEAKDEAHADVLTIGENTKTFVNVYEARTFFTGTKTLAGRAFQPGDRWTFTLSGSDEAPMPEQTSVTIEPTEGSETDVEFGEIRFGTEDAGKTFTYTATESGTVAGVTNDAAVHTVTVQVEEGEDGRQALKVTYSDGEALSFTNTYDATGILSLQGTKVLEGRNFEKGDAWTFTISSEDGPMPEQADVTIRPEIGKEAKIAFGTIAFGLADVGKTYTYEVKETGAVKDVTNDADTHTVKVTILDNGDGTLDVKTVYSDGDALCFVNTYHETKTTDAKDQHKTPNTSDRTLLPVWILLLMVSACAVSFLARHRAK